MAGSETETLLAEARELARAATEALATADDASAVAEVRSRFVGKKGSAKALQKRIATLPKDDRREAGRGANNGSEQHGCTGV